ncbi:multiple epidermal growth factor-like domains protein 10 [Papilio machaon]|uniref:multiple epidermal growth factor-like domains protein 10 n=1 Tax=Papilio machaon TaxID=76193 RepID=UPI001E663108|nr:multiple epidermal growth factor-like domains protein 10 [Papilio machaon]
MTVRCNLFKMFTNFVLLAFFVCCFDVFCVDSLQPGDPGVCVVQTSYKNWRWKTFNAQLYKWCGRKRCVEKRRRKETFMLTKNQAVCCKGWGYQSEDDSCAPLCSTGCLGGRCVAPDRCHCDAPARLDPVHGNVCLLPVCDPPCRNAHCVDNNTCECDATYVRHNATHCYRCDPGYAVDENFTCSPICDRPCANGQCIGPNICGCPTGYTLKDTFTCEPVCENTCINSVCTAPNVCTCLEGYTEVNSTCIPQCDSCDHGQCVGPNVCVCDAGYTNGTSGCVPACDQTCVNGVCSAPNVCSCMEGYVKDDDFRCVTPCPKECPGGCDDDGTCLDCSVPFRLVSGRTPRERQVKEKLVCCPSWKYDSRSKKCIYYCRFGCERGKCVGPDKCSCDPPLQLVDHKCVEPQCDPPCQHGQCHPNNTCICGADFEKINSSYCAPKCDPGYERQCINGSCDSDIDTDPIMCRPVCDPECVHGDCIAPDVCRCHEGYKNDNSSECTPVCESCGNGTCVAPNNCQCFKGYSRDERGSCIPHCETPCVNGSCSAPGVCSCPQNYTLEHTVENNTTVDKCVPVCSQTCVNAYCESPNTCACEPGYVKISGSSTICRKECDGPCENGICTLFGHCDCNQDFQLENGTCVPANITKLDCEACGGHCIAGDCRCDDDSPCSMTAAVETAEIESSARLAGLEISWVVGGAVSLLLLTLMIAVFGHMWKRRKEYGVKATDNNDGAFSSVAYTVPGTLLTMGDGRKEARDNEYDAVNDEDPSRAAAEALLEDKNDPDV